MTIVIIFQLSGYRNFKHSDIDCVDRYHRHAFPKRVSYSPFVQPHALCAGASVAFVHTR